MLLGCVGLCSVLSVVFACVCAFMHICSIVVFRLIVLSSGGRVCLCCVVLRFVARRGAAFCFVWHWLFWVLLCVVGRSVFSYAVWGCLVRACVVFVWVCLALLGFAHLRSALLCYSLCIVVLGCVRCCLALLGFVWQYLHFIGLV